MHMLHMPQARAHERAGGVPAALRDAEYIHNVMYQFLTLPSEPEREVLLYMCVCGRVHMCVR